MPFVTPFGYRKNTRSYNNPDMKNPFPSIGRALKKAAASSLARQIAASAFTLGGLPSVGAAIRKVDDALQTGGSWAEIKSGLLEQALARPEQAALILEIIRVKEAALRESQGVR